MDTTIGHYLEEKLWEFLFSSSFTITELQGNFPTRALMFTYVYAVGDR